MLNLSWVVILVLCFLLLGVKLDSLEICRVVCQDHGPLSVVKSCRNFVGPKSVRKLLWHLKATLYTYCYLTINSTDSESSLPICPLLLNLDTDQIIAFHFYIRSSTNGLSAQQLRLLVCREMSSKDGVTSLKNHVRILCYGSGFEYDSKSSDLEPGYIIRLDINMF